MTLYFVRHGQTDWNKALRWQGGAADTELNQTGREQAEAVAAYFVELGFAERGALDRPARPAYVLSSPLKRAQYTAAKIADALGLHVVIEGAFRELNLGDYEGKTTPELEQQYGAVFTHWLSRHHQIAPPGGENLQQGIARMAPALQSWIAQRQGPLIIVAHQAILMAMKASLSDDLSDQALASYKQANFEIDVWDIDAAKLRQRIDVRV